MAEMFVTEFESSEARDLYNKVGELLGPDLAAGLQTHAAGLDGPSLIVVETWEDRASQEKFMAEKLGPAFAKAGVPEPTRSTWFNVIGEMHR